MEPKFILKLASPAVGFAFLAAFVLSGDFQSAKAAGAGALSEVYMAQQAGGKGKQKKPAKAVQKEVEKVVKEVQKDAEKVEKGAGKEVKKQTKTNQGKALGKARAPGQRVREEAHRLKDMPKEARPGAAKTLRERAMEGSELEKAQKSLQKATKETEEAEEAREKAEVEGGKSQEEAEKEVEETEKTTEETEKAQQEARKKMEERAKAVEKERAGAKKRGEEVKKDRR